MPPVYHNPPSLQILAASPCRPSCVPVSTSQRLLPATAIHSSSSDPILLHSSPTFFPDAEREHGPLFQRLQGEPAGARFAGIPALAAFAPAAKAQRVKESSASARSPCLPHDRPFRFGATSQVGNGHSLPAWSAHTTNPSRLRWHAYCGLAGLRSRRVVAVPSQSKRGLWHSLRAPSHAFSRAYTGASEIHHLPDPRHRTPQAHFAIGRTGQRRATVHPA